MHDLLDFAIECKEAGFNSTFEFSGFGDAIRFLHYKNKKISTENQKRYYTFFADLTKEKLQQIKDETIAIINEVDIKEITDKSQNIGC